MKNEIFRKIDFWFENWTVLRNLAGKSKLKLNIMQFFIFVIWWGCSSWPVVNFLEVFGMPWFPRRVGDLDKSAHRVLTYGNGINVDLDTDHPVCQNSTMSYFVGRFDCLLTSGSSPGVFFRVPGIQRPGLPQTTAIFCRHCITLSSVRNPFRKK